MTAARHAHAAVRKAIRRGEIAPLDGMILCFDCDAPAAAYDHRDYAAPLTVEPVCDQCNLRRGAAQGDLHEEKSIRIRTTTHRNLRRTAAETGETIMDLLDRLAAEEWARVGAAALAEARVDLERLAIAARS